MDDVKINVKGTEIIVFRKRDDDYISLTDIAKYKNSLESGLVIANWLRSRNTNVIEFDNIKNFKNL